MIHVPSNELCFFRMENYVSYVKNASQLMAHRNADVIAGYDQ